MSLAAKIATDTRVDKSMSECMYMSVYMSMYIYIYIYIDRCRLSDFFLLHALLGNTSSPLLPETRNAPQQLTLS